MPTKAFAIEDGNLVTRSLVTTRNKLFSDFDLLFQKRPNGDIFKKTDAAAVKQSVKTILMTNLVEKPFNPDFGSNLSSLLFQLDTEVDGDLFQEVIVNALETYEPRVKVLDVKVNVSSRYHSANVTVVFQVINTKEVVTVDVSVTRVR
jgi:phage baseplate assembly protein W